LSFNEISKIPLFLAKQLDVKYLDLSENPIQKKLKILNLQQ
jgi:hypothetical protein